MKILSADESSIEIAAKALSDGLLVAFPTETVYGLGANASDAEAIKRLYEAKGRPSNHPVIVHLARMDQLSEWASVVPESARRLGEALWPGPLTMILPKASHVRDDITGGQHSVGLRIPNHPVAQALLKKFGGGIIAPSANKFGRLSPTTAADVAADFEHEVAIVLDGGACEVGIESTIVDFTVSPPRILRPGMVLAEQIEAIIGELQRPGAPVVSSAPLTRAPGDLPSHYAPATPLRLLDAADLSHRLKDLRHKGLKVCVLSFESNQAGDIPWIVAPRQPALYAHELYRNLRMLDRNKAAFILVENVPRTDDWSGVADRLRRASSGSTEFPT